MELPKQYERVIKDFILAFYNDRKWQIEQAFIGLQVKPGMAEVDLSQILYGSALAGQLADIARAAAGECEHTEDGAVETIIYQSVQDLMEWLFAPPGLGTAYDIPARFWETPLGEMCARALLWVKRDELITLTEAAELAGVTVQTMSRAVTEGRLRGYSNPDAVNPQKEGRLVSRQEVEERWKN